MLVKSKTPWTIQEDRRLGSAVAILGVNMWTRCAIDFFDGQKTANDCQYRWEEVLKFGKEPSPWTREEDATIIRCIKVGQTDWTSISHHVPDRTPEECHDRWQNALKGAVLKRKVMWEPLHDRYLTEAVQNLGENWFVIAKLLPKYSELTLSNRWKTIQMRRPRPLKVNRTWTKLDYTGLLIEG